MPAAPQRTKHSLMLSCGRPQLPRRGGRPHGQPRPSVPQQAIWAVLYGADSEAPVVRALPSRPGASQQAGGPMRLAAIDGAMQLDDMDRDQLSEVARTLGHPAATWERLVAKPAHQARPQSLSGVHGLGALPWHTDGAVAVHPPRYVILLSATGSSVSTELLELEATEHVQLVRDLERLHLRVTIPCGRVRYVPAVILTSGRPVVRWDVRVAAPPKTQLGELVSSGLRASRPTRTIAWQPGRAVVIDNRRTLHRRPVVPTGVERELERLYVY